MFLPLTQRIVKYSFANKYFTVLSGIDSGKRLPWETKPQHKPSACCIQVDSRPAFVRNDSTCPQPDQMARTGLPLQDVVKKLDTFAPQILAESWDNVGLLLEPVTPRQITRILLTIDLTDAVMQEALDLSVEMIVSYHPPIFSALKSVIPSKGWKERCVALCLENKIALYSPHTSWDAVQGGVNDWLASAFETVCLQPIIHTYNPSCFELAITVPGTTDANAVIRQLRSEVEKSERMDQGDESCVAYIIEMIEGYQVIKISCSQTMLPKYEKFYNGLFATSKDFALKVTKYEQNIVPGHGMGRVIRLMYPIPVSQVVDKIKKFLNLPHLRLALAVGKDTESTVCTIAMCAGSGHSVLKHARADLFLTGEMLHHDILAINHNGSHVVLTNHSDSERGFLVGFADLFANQLLDGKVTVLVSKMDCDPLKTI